MKKETTLPSNSRFKELHIDWFKRSQGLGVTATYEAFIYTSNLTYEKYKIKIDILHDAYDSQSYARVDVWSNAALSWNRVADIPYKLMTSVQQDINYTIEATDTRFRSAARKDIEILIKKADDILR